MDLKPEWLRALRRIQTKFPEAVIAGGCLRDTYLGETPKDIDVFVEARGDQTHALLLEALGCNVEVLTPEFALQYEVHFSELHSIYDAGYIQEDVVDDGYLYTPGTALQIIAMNTPVTTLSVMNRIDFGICRIAHDGTNASITYAFHEDVARKTFTFLREPVNAKDLARSKRRFDRISGRWIKSDGWRLVNPYAFDVVTPQPGGHLDY